MHACECMHKHSMFYPILPPVQCGRRSTSRVQTVEGRREWPVCKEHCEEVEGGGRSQITLGLYKASKEFGFGSKCNDPPLKQEEMSEQ